MTVRLITEDGREHVRDARDPRGLVDGPDGWQLDGVRIVRAEYSFGLVVTYGDDEAGQPA